jgi:hypothetical protein
MGKLDNIVPASVYYGDKIEEEVSITNSEVTAKTGP